MGDDVGVHVGEVCESNRSYVLEVPDLDFIRPCGVVVLLCFISAWTCVMLVVFRLSVFLSMFVLCVLCLTVLVNYLLNAFAICVGEVNVFSLKVIMLFLGCVGYVLANQCIVFQRVCVLRL